MKKEQYEVHAKLGHRQWWHYGTKMFFQRLVRRTLPRGAHLLDAGCGVGDMIILLKDNYHVIGVDYSEDAIRFCSEKGIAKNVIMGDINNLPFEDEVFDGVLSLDVLYHKWVSDDAHALREIYRVLRPGGKVFIQLPAYNWLKSSHDEWAFSNHRYTAKRLAALLTETGFTRKKVGYRVSFLFPLAVVRRIFFKSGNSDMKEINPVLNSIVRMIIVFENLLAQYIRFPFGLSVIGVVEK